MSTLRQRLLLDPDQQSDRAQTLEALLFARIVGQDEAVKQIARFYQIYQAGFNPPGRPIGILLFLGPTGAGKTRVVEAAAEVLFDDPNAVVKIDCAEFQHSHEIAKLIGSPPGYLGHRETTPLLTQENLNRYHTPEHKLTLLLFDEIEKADNALWQLLLGILDKAVLTLGDNRRVDFNSTLVFMTSNLGAREMSELISGSIGFAPQRRAQEVLALRVKICHTAIEAARRKFSPEFINRIDQIVVFQSLQEDHLRAILKIELDLLQKRILAGACKFCFRCTDGAKRMILEDGLDMRYGARHLKRSIERHLVLPLAKLVASRQIKANDSIVVDQGEKGLIFYKQPELVAKAGG